MIFQARTWKLLLLIVAAQLLVGCYGGLVGGDDEKKKKKAPGHRGYALAIGLNKVDPRHYGGWSGALTGCEADAKDMSAIAKDLGFKVDLLLTGDATRKAILEKLEELADTLDPGDLLVVSYSGHGGFVPDANGDEKDGHDETWVLHDGQLLDDELHLAWSKFKAGVRILVFFDSCHSGTVLELEQGDAENPESPRMSALSEAFKRRERPARVAHNEILKTSEMREAFAVRLDLRQAIARFKSRGLEPRLRPTEPDSIFVIRMMPPRKSAQVYLDNRAFYDRIGGLNPGEGDLEIRASVLRFSGCLEFQASVDLGFNGLFTWKVKQTWARGGFDGDYRKFHEKITKAVRQVNPEQSPDLAAAGAVSDLFLGQKPFALGE